MRIRTQMDTEHASTFPLTEEPTGSGLTVTVPFKASSRTFADTVVLIGTPSLLNKCNRELRKAKHSKRQKF